MEYKPGSVSSRLGFSIAYAANLPISALYNWISSLGNNLVFYTTSDNSVHLVDITTPSDVVVIPGDLLGAAAIFSPAGARLYAAFFSSTGTGASGARVITFQNSAYVNDLCFLPPITYVPPAPTEPGVGTITAGLHYLAYRIEYRSGFITRPSPDSGNGTPGPSTFQPISFTAAGSKNLSWTLTTTWPPGAVNVYMIMTPVANPAQYFLVPGAVQPVVGGVSSAITFTIDISDDILFAQAVDSTNSIFLLTNSTVGVPPFFPVAVVAHGSRMTYITVVNDSVGNPSGAIYVSGRSAFQEITPDLSLIQLPGFNQITTAISLDGVYYMFGPQSTYRTIDNGSDPVTWPAPALVDGRRGTLAVKGALVAPSGTYAWVASQDGLYFFQGVFSPLPISYYQTPDWNRINWDAAQVVDIKDDPTVKKIYVIAPLDDAVTPSHILTWDYTQGFSPEQSAYSLDTIRNYNLGAIEVVKNTLSGMPIGVPQRKELWVAPSDATAILRRNSINDTHPWRDNNQPVASQWESSLFPHLGSGGGEVYQHHGADIRIKGNGPVSVVAYELDHSQQYDLLDIQCVAQPGEIIHRGLDFVSEGCSYRFAQSTSDLNLIADPDFTLTADC